MKKLMVILMLNFFLIVGITPTSCLAYEPLRVAILPVFDRSSTYDQDTEQVIRGALRDRFRMPLAKVITLYDVIPTNEVQLALPHELENRNKLGKINAFMLQEIGLKLKADVVIGAEITDFSEIIVSNFRGDQFQRTYLTIRIVGYDTRKNEFLDIHDSRDYSGEWSVMGRPDYLATQIMDRLIEKVPYTWKN